MKKIVISLILLSLAPQVIADEIPSGKDLRIQAEGKTRVIETHDLKQMIEESPDLVLVDIRTKAEIERMGGAIEAPQNVNIPRGWLEFSIQEKALDKDTPIVVYCGGGIRSPLAADTLQQMGYTNVWNYSDGYFGWIKTQ